MVKFSIAFKTFQNHCIFELTFSREFTCSIGNDQWKTDTCSDFHSPTNAAIGRLIVALQLVIETEQRSKAVDEFATSYPLVIEWMVGNSES